MRLLRWGRADSGSREHVALTLGTNLVLAVLNAGTGITLARVLGPAGRGTLQAVQLWGLLLGLIAGLGVPEAITYFTAKRRDDAGVVSTSAMALGLLSSLGFLVVGWFTVPSLLGGQTEEVKEWARWFLLIIPVYVLVWMPAATLRGLSLFSRWNLLRISPSALWLVVVIGSWLSGNFTPNVLAAGFFVAFCLQMIINLTVLRVSAPGPYRVEPERWKPMLRYGIPNVMGSVPQLLNLQLDQMLLVAFVPNDELGLYVVGVAWAGALAPVLYALGAVLFPRVAGEASEEERIRILAKGFRLALVVATGSVIALLLLTYPGIQLLFGTNFKAAVPAALILVVAAGVLAIANLLQEGFRGLGLPAEVLYSELAGLVATAVLLAVLLPGLGIVGAACASLGGYFVTVVVCLVRLRRFAARPLRHDLTPGAGDVREVVRGAIELLRRQSREEADPAGSA